MNPVPTLEEEEAPETLLLLQKELRNYRKILIHKRQVTLNLIRYIPVLLLELGGVSYNNITFESG